MQTYRLEIGSVKLELKSKNFFPFLENPRTSAPDATNILSCGVPKAPPNSSLLMGGPGKSMKILCKMIFSISLCVSQDQKKLIFL